MFDKRKMFQTFNLNLQNTPQNISHAQKYRRKFMTKIANFKPKIFLYTSPLTFIVEYSPLPREIYAIHCNT